MNPWGCGFFNDPNRECKRSPVAEIAIRSEDIGPVLHRVQIHLDLPSVMFQRNGERHTG
jgi:hypothetical protein